ncbi:MAG: hypothetical protein FJ404_19820, partial [Verrucomicrobia bacterium]|nr:hypothetical protein [Verrucomicrobiota bacterium]
MRLASIRLACLVAIGLAVPLRAEEASGIEFFESKVRPLLASQCYKCHSEEAAKAGKLKGALRLDTRAGVAKGGEAGPIIKPGKPEESRMIKSVRYTDENLQMPPKQRLSGEEVAILEKWVAMGAPDP